jgi:acyl phosphate:glycerol-3-phosphate acyltransferase
MIATALMWSPILIGYLLGSLPSAYIVSRLWAKVDLREEGDGHISATAAYRYLGWKALVLVLVMDFGKGILSIYIASLLTDSQLILVLTAYAVVIGHCWSLYLGFKGGLGGAVTFAVLASLALKEAFIGVGVFLIVIGITRKTSWGTYVLLCGASAALAIERESLLMIFFPLGLIAIHLIKRYQTRRANPNTTYSNEALADLKRVNKSPKH